MDEYKSDLVASFAKEEWLHIFPYYKVYHLNCMFSNHNALVFYFDSVKPETLNKNKFIFKFEESSCREEACEDLIKLAQSRGTKFYEKLSNVEISLRQVDFHNTTSIRKRIQHLEKTLEICYSSSPVVMLEQQKKVACEIDDLLEKEEIMWRQRSRATWLNEGDHNTNFFHKKASQRRKRNTIQKLKSENDSWIFKDNGAMIFLEYIHSQFIILMWKRCVT